MSLKAINSNFTDYKKEIEEIILQFDLIGKEFGNQNRNTIKVVEFKDLQLNIKSFRPPKLLNQIIYGYFRKSKANRSYHFAKKLSSHNIGTPQPIAYSESKNFLGLKKSFYVSKHINADLTYRELVEQPNYKDHETILRQFVHFTHSLHRNNILFNDHSPGNTLIIKEDIDYNFMLVDLNRMTFKELNFKERMKNFSRLTPKKEMVEVMSDEYSKITGIEYHKVFDEMWRATSKFQEKFFRKKKLKKQFLFWKNHK